MEPDVRGEPGDDAAPAAAPVPRWSGSEFFEPYAEHAEAPRPVLRLEQVLTARELTLRVDVPGVDPVRDLVLEAVDGLLTIQAERRSAPGAPTTGGEVTHGLLRRLVPLPPGVVPERMTTHCSLGVLTVTLPLADEPSTGGRVRSTRGPAATVPRPRPDAAPPDRDTEEGERPVGPVVVGVDGSRAARTALLWAADQAELWQRPLVLVHVASDEPDVVAPAAWQHADADLLSAARAVVTAQHPDLEVQTESTPAPAVPEALVLASRRASVLVLGVDATRSRASHGPRGPLEDRTAAHASCPVVLVSSEYDPDSERRRRVLTGWAPGPAGRHALAVAVAEADRRQAGLTVLTVPSVSDVEIAPLLRPPTREVQLLDDVAAAQRSAPRVLIDVVHRAGDPAEALVAESSACDLVVLGGHRTSLPASIRTGPVAGAVFRAARRPVMLVGAGAPPGVG